MCEKMLRLRPVAVLFVVLSGLLLGGGAPASASAGTTIGPVQINPVGHPHLCWQATGNGAPVLLETCASGVQAQQWSLTPDGVLMNGIGYCLEALPGRRAGVPLYIDFAGQCGGGRGQVWQYNGTTGHLFSQDTCAALGGPMTTGTAVVRRSCPRGPRWSIGYSAVTLHPGTGSGTAGRQFSASVTVADAASAQTAYGVTVKFGVVRGLSVTGVAAAGWRCDRVTLTCTGTLPAGTSRRVDLSGRLPADARPGDSYALSARTMVSGTSQLPGTKRTDALVRVTVHAAAPAAAGSPGASPRLLLLAAIVVVLLTGGGLLTGLTLRRRPVHATAYEGRRRRVESRLPGLDMPVAHPAGQPDPQGDRRARLGVRANVHVGIAHRQVNRVHHDVRPHDQDQGSATGVQLHEQRVGRDDGLGEVQNHITPRRP
jgi:hypothetical protein